MIVHRTNHSSLKDLTLNWGQQTLKASCCDLLFPPSSAFNTPSMSDMCHQLLVSVSVRTSLQAKSMAAVHACTST